jgi:hypothetical protein
MKTKMKLVLAKLILVGGSASLGLTVGCGYSNVAPVYGSITLDGKPVVGASVTFQPSTGRPSYGGTDSSGNYKLSYSLAESGAVVGSCEVRISTATEDEKGVRRKESIPKKYFSSEKLKVNVEAKSNRIDFTLDSN